MAGRKRAFDRDAVLDDAMRLFWRNGYTATSLATLTSGLGINAPSMYAAFGNKEQLFKESLMHYWGAYAWPHYQHLASDREMNFRQRLEAFLLGWITLFTDGDTPLGCLMIKSLNESEGMGFPETVTDYIREAGSEAKQVLIDVFNREISSDDLPEGTTIETWVDYLLTVLYGLAIQARAGQPEDALKATMQHVLNSMPGGR